MPALAPIVSITALHDNADVPFSPMTAGDYWLSLSHEISMQRTRRAALLAFVSNGVDHNTQRA